MAAPSFNPPIFDIEGQRTWQPQNNSGIAYDTSKLASMPPSLAECDGYREHLSDDEGWTVEWTYEIQWSDVCTAQQWLVGYSRATPSGISRICPLQDAYRPWLYCVKAEVVEPQGVPLQDPGMTYNVTDDNGDIVATNYIPGTVWAEKGYQGNRKDVTPSIGPDVFSDGMAKLRATFRALPYVVRNDYVQALVSQDELEGELGRFVERSIDWAIQGMPLLNIAKQGKLYFVGTNVEIGEPGMLLMPTATMEYRWVDVPFYPKNAIQKCVGRVNMEPFDGIPNGAFPVFPAWSLLCQAPKIKTRRNASGQVSFDIRFIMDYRPQGWNYFAKNDGSFALATFGGTPPDAATGSNLVFKPVDFRLLFAPEPPFILA